MSASVNQSVLEVFQLNKHSKQEDLEQCITWLRDIFADGSAKSISIVVKRFGGYDPQNKTSISRIKESHLSPSAAAKDNSSLILNSTGGATNNQHTELQHSISRQQYDHHGKDQGTINQRNVTDFSNDNNAPQNDQSDQSIIASDEIDPFAISESAYQLYLQQNLEDSLVLYRQSQAALENKTQEIEKKLFFQNSIYIGSILSSLKMKQEAISQLHSALRLSETLDIQKIIEESESNSKDAGKPQQQKYINSNPIYFIHLTLGNLYHEEKDLDNSIYHLNIAFDQIKDATSIIEKKSQALVLNTLGMINYAKNQIDVAIDNFSASLSIFADLLKLPECANDPALKTSYANRLNNLGEAYRRNKQIEQSIINFKESLKLKLESQEETGDHSHDATKSIASTHNNLGMSYLSSKKFKEASEHLTNAIELYEQLIEANNDTQDIYGYANILNQRGDCYKAQQELVKATEDYKKAYKFKVQSIGEENKSTAISLNNYAQLLFATKNIAKSKQAFFDLLKIQEKIFGARDNQVAQTLNNIGTVLSENQEFDQAEEMIRKAIDIYQSMQGNQQNLEKVQKNLAAIQTRKQNRAARKQDE